MKKERKTKRLIYYAAGGCVFLLLCFLLSNCQDDLEFGFPTEGTLDVQTREAASTAELAKARAYYEQARKGSEMLTRSLELEDTISKYAPYTPSMNGDPSWLYYACNQNDTLLAVDVDVTDRIMQDYILQESWEGYKKYKQLKYRRSYTRYVYTRHLKTGEEQAFFMTIVPSFDCTHNYNALIEHNTYLYRNKYLSGYVLFHNIDGTFANGWEYKDGKVIKTVLASQEAKRLGFLGENLILLKCNASYQLAFKLNERHRIQTRSSGESGYDIYGGWISGGEVVGENGGFTVTIIGGGSSGGIVAGNGGGGTPGAEGGYNPPLSQEEEKDPPTITDPVLKKIYDFARSTLEEQKDVDELTKQFKNYRTGKVGEMGMNMFIADGILIMFEINSEATGNNPARYNMTDKKISFLNSETISNFFAINEEMCHAIQCCEFYDGKATVTEANYEFEVKVLADLNTQTSNVFLKSLVGNFGWEETPGYEKYSDEYSSFIESLTKKETSWTKEDQATFDKLCKVWLNYKKQEAPSSSYANMKFKENHTAKILEELYKK